MAMSHRSLLDQCHEAFWSFTEDPLSSDRRIAAVLGVLAEHGLCDRQFLFQLSRRYLMHDIAMCQGGECPVKDNCWRYLAPADRWQSYIQAPPFTEEGCDYFWDVNEK
jgi:hypothetical protein